MSTPTTPSRAAGPRSEHTRHLPHHTGRRPSETPDRDRGEDTVGEEASALARHRDPSRTTRRATDKAPAGRGVEWVRPSDLMTRAGGRVAGRGIDFEAELARRARRLPATGVRATGRGLGHARRRVAAHKQASRQRHTGRERAHRLPPVSEFGQRRTAPYSWVSRSGIGLG